MLSQRRFQLAIGIFALFSAGSALGGSWKIEPSVAATETYSSNMGLVSSNAPVPPVSGWITELTPRIRVDGAGARLNGFLDYSREYLHYQDEYQRNHQWNRLQSLATVEAIDNWLFVDASANIDQRPRSLFQPVSSGGASAIANQSEATTTQVAPYIRGRIGGVADYRLRFNSIDGRSDDPTSPNTRVNQLVGSVKNYATTGGIGWFGDVSGTRVKNDVIGNREDMRFRAGVVVPVGSHFHVSAFSGRESTDYASASRETTTTPGVGVEWAPSKRTQFAGLREKRFFGYGHSVLLSQHTARTAWRYSDTKDVVVLPTLLAGYDPGSVHQLMSDMLEASIPDPGERNRVVRERMETMAVATLPEYSGGVQTTRLYLDRVRTASVALLGVRNTITLIMEQRDQELLPFSPNAVDNFTDSSEVREQSAALVWLHRLTRQTYFNVSLTHFKAVGLSVDDLSSKQDTVSATLTFHLSPKAVASIGASRTRADSTVAGTASENALAIFLSQGF